MKDFMFLIEYSSGGHPNDPSTQSGETLISVSAPRLIDAILELEKADGVTQIFEVQSAKCGAAHKLNIEFQWMNGVKRPSCYVVNPKRKPKF